MVANIVGGYLIDKGFITAEQLNNLLIEQQRTRVKSGFVAVAEDLMTREQADEINELQIVMDKHFDEIAVEKGYLTEGQVSALHRKKKNAFLAFAQALEDQQLLRIEQLEQCLQDFQQENHLTSSDIDDLKSDDIDRILPLYMPVDCEKYLGIAGTALRAMINFIDSNSYPGKAFFTDYLEVDACAAQYMDGSPAITCVMAGKEDALLPVASVFGKEDFETVDIDALDAVGELLNCINGLYASAMSSEGVFMEMYSPELYPQAKAVRADQILVLPIYVKEKEIMLVIGIDNTIKIEQEA